MSGLPRDVIKWLHSLGLRHSFLNPQWDMANALLVVEILRKYNSSVFTANALEGQSLEIRVHNWTLVKKAMEKMNLHISDSSLEGCMHCKHGAGKDLLVKLYKQLTKKETLSFYEPTTSTDFCDYNYQTDTPMHQRCTASSALRANIKETEKRLNKDLLYQAKKSRVILKEHNERTARMKEEHPEKFCHMETLADVAIRRTPVSYVATYTHPGCIMNEEMQETQHQTITNI